MNTHLMSHLLSRYMGRGHVDETTVSWIGEDWHRLVLCSDGAFGYITLVEFRDLVMGASNAGVVAYASYRKGRMDT